MNPKSMKHGSSCNNNHSGGHLVLAPILIGGMPLEDTESTTTQPNRGQHTTTGDPTSEQRQITGQILQEHLPPSGEHYR